jgi:predicted nicotinamide N-methyase
VVDFGSGSGVVAIAAAIAGASNNIALDSDKNALEATKLNARWNQVTIDIYDDLGALKLNKSNALILIPDVFYGRETYPYYKASSPTLESNRKS